MLNIYADRPKPRLGRAVLVFLASALLLLWPYTLLLGLVIIALSVLTLAAPRILPWALGGHLREAVLTGQDVLYEVTEDKLRISASDLEAACDWSRLAVWEERNGWLRMKADGIAPIHLRVSELRKDGVYEQTLALCKQHGKRFRRE